MVPTSNLTKGENVTELIVFKEKEPRGRIVHAEVDGGKVYCPDCQEYVHDWPATEKDRRRADNLRCESCDAYFIIETESYAGARTYKHPHLPEPGYVMRITNGPLAGWLARGIPDAVVKDFTRLWNKNKGLLISKIDWVQKQSWFSTKTDEEAVRIMCAAVRTSVSRKLANGSGLTTDWEAEVEEGVDL